MNTILDIPIVKIKTGSNPRKTFNEASLRELAETLKEHGLIQPIKVEPDGDGGFLLVAGERRLRASQMAGMTTIPSIVQGRSNHNGRERLLIAIVENEQREDMNPIDRGEAYQSLRGEYGMSVKEIAAKVGKAEVVIRNFMLLTKLDAPIQQMIRNGFWKDPRLVNALLAIPDADTRIELAMRLFKNKVSLKSSIKACARTLEMLAIGQKSPSEKKMRTPALSLSAQFSRVDADEEKSPPRWNMLRQVGKVPAWGDVVACASSTCAACPLKDIASFATCRDCGAVVFLQTLMERSQ